MARTSETHPIQVDFVLDGLLGICEMPGRKHLPKHDRSLEQDLERLKSEYHCKYLVTFVEEDREMTLKMGYETNYFFDMVKSCGVQSYHFPIRDKWLPGKGLKDCILFIVNKCKQLLTNQQMQNKESVILHCVGGKGRAPTIAALVLYILIRQCPDDLKKCNCFFDNTIPERSMKQVIQWIKKRRSGSLRNPLQNIFLKTTGVRLSIDIIK